MKRSEVREHIFKIVFRSPFYPQEEWKEQAEIYTQLLAEQKEAGWKANHTLDPEDDSEFLEYCEYLKNELREIKEKSSQILENIEEIDGVIEQISEGWKITRIGKVELAILRVAVFEIQKDDTIPVGVAINEAVEIAKNYGTDKSASFINGLLAKLV